MYARVHPTDKGKGTVPVKDFKRLYYLSKISLIRLINSFANVVNKCMLSEYFFQSVLSL